MAVTVSPGSLFLGMVHPGERVVKQVVLRAKRPFRVAAITTDHNDLCLNTSVADAARPLHVIPLQFVANDKPGKVEQTVSFQTDIEDVTPTLSILAVVKSQTPAQP